MKEKDEVKEVKEEVAAPKPEPVKPVKDEFMENYMK